MEKIGNILYLTKREFVKSANNPNGIVPDGTYRSLQQRKQLNPVGKGHGSDTLIEYESLPAVYKELVRQELCKGNDPYAWYAKQQVWDIITVDPAARQFFENYVMANGRPLSDSDKLHYSNDAAILNAFKLLLADKKQLKKMLNISIGEFWQKSIEVISDVAARWPNSLPKSERRLKPLYNDYVKNSYAALIDKRIANDTNNRKVDELLEWLIMSIFIQKQNPYHKEVHEQYLQFMRGEFELYDQATKKLINRELFLNDGEFLELSPSTIFRVLNYPRNKAVVDKVRLNALDFSDKHLPYNQRLAPFYSLSKVSIDDREPPFKLKNGKRVVSYKIIDVASQCIIGYVFSRDKEVDGVEKSGKDRALFIDCLRNMFVMLLQNGCGVPAEIEFERHIANTFLDDILKEGLIFANTRMCMAANPREKRAEHVFKRLRYDQEKNMSGFRGRPFALDEANRLREKEKRAFDFETIVDMEIKAINDHNNELHPKDNVYPGLTRWEVFMSNQNPNLLQPNWATISRHIGEMTDTSIRANKYVRVQYQDYELPSPQCINLFTSLDVEAYYIRNKAGEIKEVYLYEGDNYRCTCSLTEKYQEAKAEQTDTDIEIMHRHFGYRSGFDAMVRERVNNLGRLQPVDNNMVETALQKAGKKAVTAAVVDVSEPVKVKKQKIDLAAKAADDI